MFRFIALMAVTPGLSWRRRGLGTGLGLVLLLLGHVVTNGLTMYILQGRGPMPIWVGMISDAFPLLLWAIIARDFVSRVVEKAVGPAESAVAVRAAAASLRGSRDVSEVEERRRGQLGPQGALQPLARRDRVPAHRVEVLVALVGAVVRHQAGSTEAGALLEDGDRVVQVAELVDEPGLESLLRAVDASIGELLELLPARRSWRPLATTSRKRPNMSSSTDCSCVLLGRASCGGASSPRP